MERFERRVLVCGGRQFDQPRSVGRALAALHDKQPIDLIISGGAPGADRYAEAWAQHNRIALSVFPATDVAGAWASAETAPSYPF